MINKFSIFNFQFSKSLKANSGYAAMFSFLVMITILGTLISVFTILVLKGVFLTRTSLAEFKNIYAMEGFVEDTLKRARDTSLADTAGGETLEVGDAIVIMALTSEGTVKSYLFSGGIGGKYFGNEILRVDGTGSLAKIKKWQDAP